MKGVRLLEPEMFGASWRNEVQMAMDWEGGRGYREGLNRQFVISGDCSIQALLRLARMRMLINNFSLSTTGASHCFIFLEMDGGTGNAAQM